jgi:hypothetical protein
MINDYCSVLQTLDHWNFGLNNTGYLMDINNRLHATKEVAEMGDALLVTIGRNRTAMRIVVNRTCQKNTHPRRGKGGKIQ